MQKFDKFITILFLILSSIVFIGLIVFMNNTPEKILVLVIVIGWIFMIARSYHLENYLRIQDSLDEIKILEHINGLLNSRKKMIGLCVIARPIFDKNKYAKEIKRINRLTYGIYLIIGLMIFIIVRFL